MIEEAYVSFETAKLLKEKGFEIDTTKDYWKIGPDGTKYFMCSIGAYTSDIDNKTAYYRPADSYPCPTQQMAMRWLREVHNVHIEIDPDWVSKPEFKIIGYAFDIHSKDDPWYEHMTEYSTYEEAVEEAIKYCLNNLI